MLHGSTQTLHGSTLILHGSTLMLHGSTQMRHGSTQCFMQKVEGGTYNINFWIGFGGGGGARHGSQGFTQDSQELTVTNGGCSVKATLSFCFLVSKLCSWLPRSSHYKKYTLDRKLLTRHTDR